MLRWLEQIETKVWFLKRKTVFQCAEIEYWGLGLRQKIPIARIWKKKNSCKPNQKSKTHILSRRITFNHCLPQSTPIMSYFYPSLITPEWWIDQSKKSKHPLIPSQAASRSPQSRKPQSWNQSVSREYIEYISTWRQKDVKQWQQLLEMCEMWLLKVPEGSQEVQGGETGGFGGVVRNRLVAEMIYPPRIILFLWRSQTWCLTLAQSFLQFWHGQFSKPPDFSFRKKDFLYIFPSSLVGSPQETAGFPEVSSLLVTRKFIQLCEALSRFPTQSARICFHCIVLQLTETWAHCFMVSLSHMLIVSAY